MKFQYSIELKEGFKPATPLINESETEIVITLEARNRATADRAIKALLKKDNISDITGICVE